MCPPPLRKRDGDAPLSIEIWREIRTLLGPAALKPATRAGRLRRLTTPASDRKERRAPLDAVPCLPQLRLVGVERRRCEPRGLPRVLRTPAAGLPQRRARRRH